MAYHRKLHIEHTRQSKQPSYEFPFGIESIQFSIFSQKVASTNLSSKKKMLQTCPLLQSGLSAKT